MAPAEDSLQRQAGGFLRSWGELAGDGEPDALKGARPVREGLH